MPASVLRRRPRCGRTRSSRSGARLRRTSTALVVRPRGSAGRSGSAVASSFCLGSGLGRGALSRMAGVSRAWSSAGASSSAATSPQPSSPFVLIPAGLLEIGAGDLTASRKNDGCRSPATPRLSRLRADENGEGALPGGSPVRRLRGLEAVVVDVVSWCAKRFETMDRATLGPPYTAVETAAKFIVAVAGIRCRPGQASNGPLNASSRCPGG